MVQRVAGSSLRPLTRLCKNLTPGRWKRLSKCLGQTGAYLLDHPHPHTSQSFLIFSSFHKPHWRPHQVRLPFDLSHQCLQQVWLPLGLLDLTFLLFKLEDERHLCTRVWGVFCYLGVPRTLFRSFLIHHIPQHFNHKFFSFYNHSVQEFAVRGSFRLTEKGNKRWQPITVKL